GSVAQELLTLPERQFVSKRRRDDLWHIIGGQRAGAVFLEWRNDTLSGVPGSAKLLCIVRSIRDQLRIGVRHEHIKPVTEVSLRFELKRVVDGISFVLVQSLKWAAELWKWQQRLSNRRSADTAVQLTHPSVIRRCDAKQRLAVGREICIELRGIGAI